MIEPDPVPQPRITPLPATGRTPKRWPAAECAEEWNKTLTRIRCGGALPVRFYAQPHPSGAIELVAEMDVPDVNAHEELRPRYVFDDVTGPLGHGKGRVLLNITTISKRMALSPGHWPAHEIIRWAHATARWLYRHEADEQLRVIPADGGELRPFEPKEEHGHG